MGYPQQATAMGTGSISGLVQPPPPQESVSRVLDQTLEEMARVESQVDEVIGRLFNFPRVDQSKEKASQVPSASERILELRSRVMRINESLATILEKL